MVAAIGLSAEPLIRRWHLADDPPGVRPAVKRVNIIILAQFVRGVEIGAGLPHQFVIAYQLHAHGGPGPVFELEEALLANHKHCGQLDEGPPDRPRFVGGRPDPFLQSA
jgi:hypothetical protein